MGQRWIHLKVVKIYANATLIVSHGTVIRCFLIKISNDSKLFASFIGNYWIVKNDKFIVEDIINVNND